MEEMKKAKNGEIPKIEEVKDSTGTFYRIKYLDKTILSDNKEELIKVWNTTFT